MSAHLEYAPNPVEASAVASSSAPLTAAGGAPVKRDKSKEARMSKRGTEYLKEWAAINGLNPTQEERQTLVAGVKAIPGHDHYEMRHLTHWFAFRRARARKAAATTAPSGSPAPQVARPDLSTTLSAKQISDLQLLVARAAIIDDNLLGIWAELFQVEKHVLQTWLRDTAPKLPPTPITPTQPAWTPEGLVEAASRVGVSVEQWRHTLTSEEVLPRLPTPAATASPGPESPLLVHAQVARPQSRNNSTLLPHAQVRPASVEPIGHRTPIHDPVRDAILQGIKEGTGTSPPGTRPRTTAEFSAYWKAFEPKMNRVSQALDLSKAS